MNSAPPERGLIVAQSGAQSLVGYVVDVGQGDGLGRASLDVGETHSNRNGMLHGGIIAMLLDAACGFTASMKLGQGEALTPLVTVSLTTQFVAGARIGTRVTATGYPSGGGRKIAHVRGELVDETGQMIATAQGVFKKTPIERFQ
ncbi:MAG: PaaI family thioesterase [Sedimentitalea sp.]